MTTLKAVPPTHTTMSMQKYLNGWITPEGHFLPCEYSEHLTILRKHNYDGKTAELLGWIKVTTYDGGHLFAFHPPTQEQVNTVWEWCKSHRREDLWDKFEEQHLDERR